MKKNICLLGICFLLFSTGLLAINVSILSILSPNENATETSKVNVKELPHLALDTSWDTDGNAVCIASGSQYSRDLCSDGAGGAIITWDDHRTGTYDIYAQLIDSDGNVQWGVSGLTICIASNSQTGARICSDGMGGAIITWSDYRSGTDSDIYARCIDSDGNSVWGGAQGLVICDAIEGQYLPQICSDGAGGAIITWYDYRSVSSNGDIYAQCIDSEGNIQWGSNGIVICDAPNEQRESKLISDGAGGAIIAWKDHRDGTVNSDIYAQHINSDGNVQWGAGDLAICTANDVQRDLELCSDGAGGAIITWWDYRSVAGYDIYAQCIDSDGNIQWGSNGTGICTADGTQSYQHICSDGAGGAFITWNDYRSGTTDGDIYAQHINSNGQEQWLYNGMVICDATESQNKPKICSDGAGGVIITWQDERNGNKDIYTQHINSNGTRQFISNGLVICDSANGQVDPILFSDGAGGAIITWTDYRSGSYCDIYAQRLENPPPTSNHPADIETTKKGTETINWTLSDDSGGGQYRVLANLTGGSDSVVCDWTSWTSGSTLNVPIDRTNAGFFNYTIEYYDNQNRFGVPDMVIVQITESKSTINGYSIFILSLSICIIGLIFAIRLTRKKNLMN